ncbi:CZB domain-containing protein [Acidovorax sp. DW039]|uniref:CZB domain-containing protein n=1 Tax=Acidovorax sp. DW039 TaxID=3095606 RepID=UPI003086E3D9|nr:CZB domain-containing protein [Acidovorax sp. DW039]
MGFFSRIFKIREQDPDTVETTWAMEDNGSELVLDPEYAAMLMTELDLDSAITSHEVWRQQLEDLVHGRSTEVVHAEPICQADRCDLGRWLGGTGRLRLGHFPAFEMLVARHQYFHQQAAALVELMQAGDQPKALQLFNTSCRHASNQVLLLLKELKRGLGR